MKKTDKQLEEFENHDLGNDIKKSKVKTKMLKSTKQHATSIWLSDGLIATLKKKAMARGLKYQTFLKMILVENLGKY